MKAERIAIVVIFMVTGALAYGWWYNNQNITKHLQNQIVSFMSAGPRFTAKDGQELCERVRALESSSIGFQRDGKRPLECAYDQRP